MLGIYQKIRRTIINELMKQVAKAALLTIVPILIQAFADRYLSDEEPWVNQPPNHDLDEEGEGTEIS